MTRLALATLLAIALGACDFTPTLDIPLPEFEPALTLNGVLAADSTVEVRITGAIDPYVAAPTDDRFDVPDGTAAELFRDGASLGPLRLASTECPDYSAPVHPVDGPVVYECGAFVSDVMIEPGATYTVRATAPGFPPAEATVTVPPRVSVALDLSPRREFETGPGYTLTEIDAAISVRDPAGAGDRYALMAVSGPWSYTDSTQVCSGPSTCRDTTRTYFYPNIQFSYTTTDPVLLAAARTIPSNGITFVTFTDETFDGSTRSFDVTLRQVDYPDRDWPDIKAVWLAAVDDATFGAYQIAWFGYPLGDGFNPFQEPLDLPSNVEGGYGLLGAATITAMPID